MGGPSIARTKKRKYNGNRYSKANKVAPVTAVTSYVSTASAAKLQKSDTSIEDDVPFNEVSGYRLIDIELLISVFAILCCPLCHNSRLYLVEDSRFGLCSNFYLHCKDCSFTKGFSTSKKNNEVNTRFIYALRLIGKGFTAGKKLCATLNLPPFLSKLAFQRQVKKLLHAVTSVSQNSMKIAASEITGCVNQGNITDCGVSVDGTLQRRGFSSLNGIVSAISVMTGKVLDVEIMSQFCRKCNQINKLSSTLQPNKTKHDCANHKGSSGNMEVVGAYRIFERSEQLRELRYSIYYGDGDSKGYEVVKDIYGEDYPVTKLECIGHVQKRVGTHLRKLKATIKGLGGKGKLTDNLINKLQNYYGIAIRSNVGNLLNMQTATISVFGHCCSNKHGLCPKGEESWCKFQRQLALKKTYKETTTNLPTKILNIIRPTYLKLCDQKLLEKCLHGKTQNANESFNGLLWTIVPKNVFIELQTLRFGSFLAVVQFNEGFCGLLKVFNELGILPGHYTLQEYRAFDKERISDAKRHSLPTAKTARKKLRASRKNKSSKFEKKEGESYKSGGF